MPLEGHLPSRQVCLLPPSGPLRILVPSRLESLLRWSRPVSIRSRPDPQTCQKACHRFLAKPASDSRVLRDGLSWPAACLPGRRGKLSCHGGARRRLQITAAVAALAAHLELQPYASPETKQKCLPVGCQGPQRGWTVLTGVPPCLPQGQASGGHWVRGRSERRARRCSLLLVPWDAPARVLQPELLADGLAGVAGVVDVLPEGPHGLHAPLQQQARLWASAHTFLRCASSHTEDTLPQSELQSGRRASPPLHLWTSCLCRTSCSAEPQCGPWLQLPAPPWGPSMPSPTRLAVRCLAAMGFIVLPVACRHTLPINGGPLPHSHSVAIHAIPGENRPLLQQARLLWHHSTAPARQPGPTGHDEHAGVRVALCSGHGRLRSSAQGLGSFLVQMHGQGGIIV